MFINRGDKIRQKPLRIKGSLVQEQVGSEPKEVYLRDLRCKIENIFWIVSSGQL